MYTSGIGINSQFNEMGFQISSTKDYDQWSFLRRAKSWSSGCTISQWRVSFYVMGWHRLLVLCFQPSTLFSRSTIQFHACLVEGAWGFSIQFPHNWNPSSVETDSHNEQSVSCNSKGISSTNVCSEWGFLSRALPWCFQTSSHIIEIRIA
jgi:hypothetical protein